MEFIKLLIIILTGFTITGNSLAVSIDYKGSKPDKPEYDNDEIIPVYITVPGAAILSSPDANAAKLAEGKYLERFCLCRKFSLDKKVYLLLGKLDNTLATIKTISGWVDADNVFTGIMAMRTPQNIFRKALIINRLSEKGSRRKHRLDVADVYAAPSFNSEKIKRLGLFNFYFTWQVHKNAKGEVFYLLGTRSALPDERYPEGSILGWVCKDRILDWNTRQAIQFYKENLAQRKQPVKIFQTRKELNNWQQGLKTKEEPMAIEDVSVKSWQPEWTRFPLLNVDETDLGNDKSGIQQIGYIGDQLDVTSGKMIGGRGQVASRQQRLERLKQQIRNIDIVFAIDATGSMFKFYQFISKGLTETMTEISNKYGVKASIDRPNIRFAVIFYRDYYDKQNGIDRTFKVLPLTDDLKKALNYLSSEQVLPGQGVNPDNKSELTEAVFYSVYNGLEQLNFNKGSFRQLILVGDFGNHSPDPRGYDITRLIDALKKYETN
ncbi:MAG: vWA domain-containing protein, partial [Victivallaceae bacterium]